MNYMSIYIVVRQQQVSTFLCHKCMSLVYILSQYGNNSETDKYFKYVIAYGNILCPEIFLIIIFYSINVLLLGMFI